MLNIKYQRSAVCSEASDCRPDDLWKSPVRGDDLRRRFRNTVSTFLSKRCVSGNLEKIDRLKSTGAAEEQTALRLVFCLMSCFLLVGCSTMISGHYIKTEHSYHKKLYGKYELIVETIKMVLAKQGYPVTQDSYPSVYERPVDVSQESPQDVLLFTAPKNHASGYSHINVFVHQIKEGADVQLRYAKVTPLLFKQVTSTRNDALAKRILDAFERALIEP